MHAIVIYESLTGHTRTAAELIAQRLGTEGVTAVACPITNIDYQALSAADLVIVGSWVDGLFVVGQRPGRVGRIAKMPALAGKRAVVYLTYALDPGKALQKLSDTVSSRGAEVLGGITIRRDRIEEGTADLVDRILGVVPA
ncbi:MAG: flavodoxin domain-containing protein [Acidimicrobiales bacterium]|nr:flavodoxin domain-containing protein [Acidimicrobiales bacterium]